MPIQQYLLGIELTEKTTFVKNLENKNSNFEMVIHFVTKAYILYYTYCSYYSLINHDSRSVNNTKIVIHTTWIVFCMEKKT